MEKIVRLTETDLIEIIKKVISEQSDRPKNLKDEISRINAKFPMFDELKEYIQKKCILVSHSGDYLIYDVQTPTDFEQAGFNRSDAVAIKNKLRKKGFQSLGVGEYYIKIN
jgi:hypothetical protein